MLLFFNSADVYCGYSSSELNRVLDGLSQAKIRYKWKPLNFGGLNRFTEGTDKNYSVMYMVRVHKKDALQAGHIVNKALHPSTK